MISAMATAGPLVLSEQATSTDLVAKYLRVLGEPTRLRILELLVEGERSVGALVDALGESQPKVSNHLACLRWCGFVETRREHRAVYYSVADERVEQIIDLAHALLADNSEHVAACVRVDGGC